MEVDTKTDVPQLTMIDKISLFFTAKGAYEKFLAGPKSSFVSGSFWAKACAAVVTIWAGAQGFVPHPYDIYITVGLAIWASLESYYLKKNHLDALVDLSSAPSLDMNKLADTMAAIVTKFPGFAPAVAPVTAAVSEIVKESTSVSVNAPVAAPTPPAPLL